MIASLAHSRLNYGNFVLVGLPAYQQRQLQTVRSHRSCSITLCSDSADTTTFQMHYRSCSGYVRTHWRNVASKSGGTKLLLPTPPLLSLAVKEPLYVHQSQSTSSW
jgi:hypothetical protein